MRKHFFRFFEYILIFFAILHAILFCKFLIILLVVTNILTSVRANNFLI